MTVKALDLVGESAAKSLHMLLTPKKHAAKAWPARCRRRAWPTSC
jgi:hypothetical protein